MNEIEESGADTKAVVSGNTDFAFDLYAQLKASESNLFFSPYSLSVALALALAGARGDTETQMAQTLQLDLDQQRLHPAVAALQAGLDAVQARGFVQLRTANALWPQRGYPFLEDFLRLAEEYYGVSITPLDFGDEPTARKTINAWVAEETGDTMTNLIARGVLTSLTRLVLTNAIYFKGDWAAQFDEERTEDIPFWSSPDEPVDVPMMSQTETFGYSARESGPQVLEMPYAGDELSMIVLLPEALDGIRELEAALTVDNLQLWTRNLSRMKVRVQLPRFKIRCQYGLNRVLRSMGMVNAFEDADFSGLDGSTKLSISAVIHQAFVDVNEEGTEAAAATAVVFATRSLPALAPTFRADHPFIFLIRDNLTGSILFLGRVTNPKSSAS